MIKASHYGYVILLPLLLTSCTKNTCPDYWEYPDCKTQSRTRFIGMYKGTSIMDNGNQATTQWYFNTGPEIGELSLSPDMIVKLDPKDPRAFKIKDRSFMGNNLYIREEGSSGFFNGNTVTMEFWMDEGKTAVPGEKLIHYTFTGERH